MNHHHQWDKAMDTENGAVKTCRHDSYKEELRFSKVGAGKDSGGKRDKT